MRKLILLFLFTSFYLGFFTKSSLLISVVSSASDVLLHFIVFLTYPIIVFACLPKNKFFILSNLVFFCCMTIGVEILQRKYFNRSYSITDFKFSLLGFTVACLFIFIYFKYLSNASIAKS